MPKYSLKYEFKGESKKDGFTENDSTTKHTLCDALILISIMRPEDGSYSQMVASIDGQKDDHLSDEDIFKA